MKKVVFAIILLAFCSSAFAQNSLREGNSQLNFGVGLSEHGIPVYLGFDHGVSKDITLGAELSYQSYDERWKDNYYNRSVIGICGNGNYHFNNALNISRDWDFYAGLNLGFFVWSNEPYNYDGTHTSGLRLGAQIGGRYFLSKKVGLNLEIGGGNAFSGGKFGLTIKL